jgi:glycosyltransferase involved in cell wall biosynthesis
LRLRGINTCVPVTGLTPVEARRNLGIEDGDKTILFFGSIRPYKGLEYLVEAFCDRAREHPEYRLIIAGEPKNNSDRYLSELQGSLNSEPELKVIQRIHHVPDEEAELYFKAADVLVLPYTHIFQSGVLFLAYSFGLPVIAADVGSFHEDVMEAGRDSSVSRAIRAAWQPR